MELVRRDRVVERLRHLCVAWRTAVDRRASGDLGAVLAELRMMLVTGEELAASGVARVVT